MDLNLHVSIFNVLYYVRTFTDTLSESFLELFCEISCYVCKFVIVDEIHDFFMICILISDYYRMLAAAKF